MSYELGLIASDAIEAELSKPRRWRIRNIFRPETLTAWATAAAALAAFMSVIAATRQEEATYKSIAYGKQIDLFISFEESSAAMNAYLGDKSMRIFPDDPNDGDIQTYTLTYTAIAQTDDLLRKMTVLLPGEARPSIETMTLYISNIGNEIRKEDETELSMMRTHHTTSKDLINYRNEYQLTFKNNFVAMQGAGRTLYICLERQLKNNDIEGKRLERCLQSRRGG